MCLVLGRFPKLQRCQSVIREREILDTVTGCMRVWSENRLCLG